MKHEIIDQGDTKKYFTQIPNIIYDLGLTPYEQVLYDHLKRSAEARGHCSKSTRTLAQECRMSPTVIVKAKASLAKPRVELNKKPLIKITKRENPKGGKEYDEISIVDIWRENTNRYAPPEHENQVLDMELAPDGQVPRNGLASTTVSVKQVPVVEHRKILREEDIKQEDKNTEGLIDSALKPPYSGAAFLESLQLFKEHRDKIKKPLDANAEMLLFRKLSAWGEAVSTQALQDSVINRWQGVFEPRQNGNNQNGSGKTTNRDFEFKPKSIIR